MTWPVASNPSPSIASVNVCVCVCVPPCRLVETAVNQRFISERCATRATLAAAGRTTEEEEEEEEEEEKKGECNESIEWMQRGTCEAEVGTEGYASIISALSPPFGLKAESYRSTPICPVTSNLSLVFLVVLDCGRY